MQNTTYKLFETSGKRVKLQEFVACIHMYSYSVHIHIYTHSQLVVINYRIIIMSTYGIYTFIRARKYHFRLIGSNEVLCYVQPLVFSFEAFGANKLH